MVKLSVKLVKGGLDKAVANKQLKRRISAVRSCYEGALDKNPKLGGVLQVIVEILADGSVSRVVVAKGGLGGKIGKCVQGKLSAMKFPALPAEAGDKKRYIKATLDFSTR